MPYLITPKDNPNIWAYLVPLSFDLMINHHDWGTDFNNFNGQDQDALCSCCLRPLVATGSARILTYRNYQCEQCLRHICNWRDKGQPQHTLTVAESFARRQDAVSAFDPKTQEIVFRPSLEDFDAWHTRCQGLIERTERISPPWPIKDTLCFTHYAHLPYDRPNHIAFYRDVESGIADKLTYMKVGRYLTEFYPRMSAEDKAKYIAEIAALAAATFSLATTPEDITTIYNTASGPDSCMRRKLSPEYDWQKLLDADRMPCHPCATYGNSDLALAYTGPLESVSQRCVVWPKEKKFVRVYGTGPLLQLLLKEGYQEGSFAGARIRRVTFMDPVSGHRATVIPYVDRLMKSGGARRYCADTANRDGEWLILQNSDTGEYSLGETRGHNSDDIFGDQRPMRECENCSMEYDEDDMHGDLCQGCWSETYFTCVQCNRTLARCNETPTMHPTNDTPHCARCIAQMTMACSHPDCNETFVESFRPRSERNLRQEQGVNSLCAAHATQHRHSWGGFEVQVFRGPHVRPMEVRHRRRGEWYCVSSLTQARRGTGGLIMPTREVAESLMAEMHSVHPDSQYRVVDLSAPAEPTNPNPVEVSSDASPF